MAGGKWRGRQTKLKIRKSLPFSATTSKHEKYDLSRARLNCLYIS